MVSILGKFIDIIWQAVTVIILGIIGYRMKLARKNPPQQTESDDTKFILSKIEQAINTAIDQKAKYIEEQEYSIDEMSDYSFDNGIEFEASSEEFDLADDDDVEEIEVLDIEKSIPVYDMKQSTSVSCSMQTKHHSTSSRIRHAFILQEVFGKPKSIR